MTGLQPITIDGRAGTVVYVDDRWRPVEPDHATLAKVHFSDGRIVFYQVGPKDAPIEAEPRALYREDQSRDEAGRFSYEGGDMGEGGEPGRFTDRETGAAPRTFTGNDGYDWHEQGPVAEWATTLPYADVRAIGDYASFGYADVNKHLRGQFTPRITDEQIREATPAEIAAWNPVGKQHASDYDDADPANKVADGRIVRTFFYKDGYKPDGPNEQIESFHIEKAGPDEKYVRQLEQTAAQINEAIGERGYILPEPITVNRAAYIPGLSYDDLKAMEGSVIVEDGFSSTMVGDPGRRLDAYVVNGKTESLYKRYADTEGSTAIYKRQDEVGAAMRIQIVLPEGTKVAAVEPVRRIEHEFPYRVIPVPESMKDDAYFREHPERYTARDYTATPTIKTDRLRDPSSRSEAEVLLGSGARFRVVSVRRGDRRITSSDPRLHPIDVIDVKLEYVGGGSSAP